MTSIDLRIAALSPGRRSVLERRLLAWGRPAEAGSAPRAGDAGAGPAPLSFAQERLWFFEQLHPGSAVYNIPVALRLPGSLDPALLKRALAEIVARHAALRTTFAARDGSPVQVVAPHVALDLPLDDLSALPADARQAEAARRATEEGRLPFDLAAGPLLRARLLKLAADDHLLLLTLHHIVSDGWSMGVLFRELSALYPAFLAGRPSPLPPLPIQYPDYARWQRDWLAGDELERQLSYWRTQLAGCPALIDLPTDRPHPPVQSYAGGLFTFTIPAPLVQRLRALGQQRGATLFMTLLAAFKVLLLRYCGQDDIVVGTPIANRTRVEVEPLIGFFVNTLVLRTSLAADPSFAEVVDRVRDTTLAAYAHQDLPFERLVEEIQPERSLGHHPLFQVMFVLQNADAPGPAAAPDPARAAPQVELGTGRFDLTFAASETGQGLEAVLDYNSDLFDPATVARMAAHFQVVLEAAAAAPGLSVSQVPIMDAAEAGRMRELGRGPALPYASDSCVHRLFEQQSARTPRAPALACGAEIVDYATLNARCNRLARHLQACGVGPGSRVALCLERSVAMVEMILATLKAGAAYVPLDAGYPVPRLDVMLADCGAAVLVVDEASPAGLAIPAGTRLVTLAEARAGARDLPDDHLPDDHLPDDNLADDCGASGLAYVIYTSGSTGTPKGVSIAHRGLCNVVAAQRILFGLGPRDRVLHVASPSFDASVFELLLAFGAGATLCIPVPDREAPGAPALAALAEMGVTAAVLPPSVLAVLPHPLPALSTLIVAGEACPPSLAEQWAAGRRFFNAYGPTEATIWATTHRYQPGSGCLPIGRPIPNARLLVADSAGRPVPFGVRGEIWIGGEGVAAGYLGRPELTADRFVATADGERFYRTGDLGRWRADGTLEFLGRRDSQVKIRGVRVEIGEVEAALAAAPEVREAAVLALPDSAGSLRLTAYVVLADAAAPIDDLRRRLRARLPDVMVPTAWMRLDALPVTPNGKVDRKALPRPDDAGLDRPPFAPPSTPEEHSLTRLWQELLGVEPVGVNDNFFDLGGHSLLATRLAARLQEAFGRAVPLRLVFEQPTVAELAAALAASAPAPQPDAIAADPGADVAARVDAMGAGDVDRELARLLGLAAQAAPAEPAGMPPDPPAPLSFAQERLWFFEQLHPGSAVYNIPVALRLPGSL
ncbi:non-ribosomal peptide synthetase, partial [Azorhizobium doebereinerae]|uniref:non-ribosomal peptide synthetase n=1 Tax=Azorhizobium doebereinerae TaxID=281091 RepID=UPI00048BF039